MKKASWLRSSYVVLSLLLSACGGGGGGSAPASVTYSGASTQATVTAANARVLSVDAFQGGQTGSTLGITGVVTQGDGVPAGNDARLQTLGNTLEGAVARLVPPASSGSPVAAGASVQTTIAGPYGGSMTYSITYNEISGAFSGAISFSAYKGDPNGASVSGSVAFSGTFDQVSQTFTALTVSFTSLVVTEGGVAFTAAGSVSVSVGTGTETTTISLVLQNSTTGKTYWVKDYTYTLNGGALTISGTYYDPVHGYVTISTLTPLQVTSSDAWPTAGVLLFTGANGSSARLTFSAAGYTVEVDTGNGVYTTVP